ncbi:DNA topoisomerase 3-alpha isoform X1 [Neodiprion virginianus]|uniref:DNA topoisomerase 3-alpha isoform X1 n=2 Tax=Neodiprion virginianus TaxID=2961670 RepID=UPI001EE6E8B4|nr:DNA topoisomerase 3-alpha isoform X1 [Neodiprion virginianus]
MKFTSKITKIKVKKYSFIDLRTTWIQLAKFSSSDTVKELYNSGKNVMKVLNVAEKNDAAKGIAGYLSRGSSHRREGLSVYNKIYEFDTQLWGQQCKMIMTSVSGHLLNHEFVGGYRNWQGCNPLSLFEAPVVKQCEENFMKIKKTLEREAKGCQALIIWTDCDREGENIGFEVIQVCQAVKPTIKIYRAKFSEITAPSVTRALHNLGVPNKAISDAVDVRSELDLRIGAAFTRFQTMRLQKVFPQTLAEMLISYGSCQFPTLGFVVERFLAIENFKSEPFWKIKVTDERDGILVEFRWDRNRLFERLPCQIFLDMCLESPTATVEKVTCKQKSKWRPLPLDTVELAKLGSRKLKLNAKETMKIAEKLYTQGIISYPRTETNIFPKELNLVPLVEHQSASPQWGPFAQQILQHGPFPRQGKKNDGAHPPIHPTKYIATLGGNEARVYEFIVRHFLASISKDAEGQETIVHIDIAQEKFIASGLHIIAKNYLEVYPYETWNAKEIHAYEEGQTFRPTGIEMVDGETSPPNLLTEADLIALMDKHGIGTDATHAEHIEKIKSRQYVGLKDQKYFIPGKLGIGLVMGYDSMGFHMSKPHLRAGLENDLKLICDGVKQPADVLQDQISRYKTVFTATLRQAGLIDEALAHYLDEQPAQVQHAEIANPDPDIIVYKCPKCGSNMLLKDRRNTPGKYIGCMAFPTCNNSIWFPTTVENIEVLNNKCNRCPGNMPLLKFTLRQGTLPHLGTSYTSCIGGCDTVLNETFDIRTHSVQNVPQAGNGGAPQTNSNQNPRTNQTRQNAQRQPNGQINNSRANDTSRTDSGVSTWSSAPSMTSVRHNKFSNRSSNQNQQNMETDDTILCNCHERAIELTVRKEGTNKGRQFYKCAKPQENSCDFFLWAAENALPNDNANRNHSQPSRNTNSSYSNQTQQSQTNMRFDREAGGSSSSQGITCTCGQPARKLTVHKEGPNKGREFYGCPQGIGTTCKFFKWADENDDDGSCDNGQRTHTGGFRGGRNTQNANLPRARNPSKRKCGLCGQEGHTRRTCSQNDAG